MCPKCGFSRGELTEDQIKEFARRKARDRIYHLRMTSYLVITVFLAAFGWYWWDSRGFSMQPSYGPILLLGLGTVGYVVIRALLFHARKQLKKLN